MVKLVSSNHTAGNIFVNVFTIVVGSLQTLPWDLWSLPTNMKNFTKIRKILGLPMNESFNSGQGFSGERSLEKMFERQFYSESGSKVFCGGLTQSREVVYWFTPALVKRIWPDQTSISTIKENIIHESFQHFTANLSLFLLKSVV